jgi:hypothetical protein
MMRKVFLSSRASVLTKAASSAAMASMGGASRGTVGHSRASKGAEGLAHAGHPDRGAPGAARRQSAAPTGSPTAMRAATRGSNCAAALAHRVAVREPGTLAAVKPPGGPKPATSANSRRGHSTTQGSRGRQRAHGAREGRGHRGLEAIEHHRLGQRQAQAVQRPSGHPQRLAGAAPHPPRGSRPPCATSSTPCPGSATAGRRRPAAPAPGWTSKPTRPHSAAGTRMEATPCPTPGPPPPGPAPAEPAAPEDEPPGMRATAASAGLAGVPSGGFSPPRVGELGHVGLAHQPQHPRRAGAPRPWRHAPPEPHRRRHHRAGQGDLTRHVVQVLDRHGQACSGQAGSRQRAAGRQHGARRPVPPGGRGWVKTRAAEAARPAPGRRPPGLRG